MKTKIIISIIISILGCNKKQADKSYEHNISLLNTQTKIVELIANNGQSRIAVAPEYQGRIATSTNAGLTGKSLGWLNLDAFNSGDKLNGSEIHGEERVWIGPLGSQFSFFYGQQKPLDENNWAVPESFNSEPFQLISQSETSVKLEKEIKLTNFIGTSFNMNLEREIQIFENEKIEELLNFSIPENVSTIGYQTNQVLTNTDSISWEKTTGLATIWSLSTFRGTDNCVTFIPTKETSCSDTVFQYLNKFDKDRFLVCKNAAWYKTDGKYRSKIGVPPSLSKGLICNYQPENNTLRIIQFKQLPEDSLYFNSDVAEQANPYSGEAIAIYNHGPMDLTIGNENQFFEMESMATMKELQPRESVSHYHRVFQFTGELKKLNYISKKVIGVDLENNPF